MVAIAAWPREKVAAEPVAAPAAASKDEEFDLEKIIRYVLRLRYWEKDTNNPATSPRRSPSRVHRNTIIFKFKPAMLMIGNSREE